MAEQQREPSIGPAPPGADQGGIPIGMRYAPMAQPTDPSLAWRKAEGIQHAPPESWMHWLGRYAKEHPAEALMTIGSIYSLGAELAPLAATRLGIAATQGIGKTFLPQSAEAIEAGLGGEEGLMPMLKAAFARKLAKAQMRRAVRRGTSESSVASSFWDDAGSAILKAPRPGAQKAAEAAKRGGGWLEKNKYELNDLVKTVADFFAK